MPVHPEPPKDNQRCFFPIRADPNLGTLDEASEPLVDFDSRVSSRTGDVEARSLRYQNLESSRRRLWASAWRCHIAQADYPRDGKYISGFTG
jgi:hypothetical protein